MGITHDDFEQHFVRLALKHGGRVLRELSGEARLNQQGRGENRSLANGIDTTASQYMKFLVL